MDGKALSWGRNNPSAANVAFSILADLYGEKEAEFLHGPFLVAVVASLPENEWRLRADYVCAWVDWLRAETSQAAMIDCLLADCFPRLQAGYADNRAKIGH